MWLTRGEIKGTKAMTKSRQRKKVFFVNPANEPFTERALLIEAIDLLTLASFAKSLGHDVVVKDFDREKTKSAEALRVLEAMEPDVLVITFDYHIPLFTSEAINGVRELCQMASELGTKVVIGGKSAKKYPESFLLSDSCVVIIGEMEPALEELLALDDWSCEKLSKVQGIAFARGGNERKNIKKTGLRKGAFDIERLPIPDRSLLPISDYIDVRSMLSSRSCIERCKFCSVHQFWGPWRMRSPEKVFEEIEYLASEYGAKKVILLDDHAMANGSRMKKLSKLLSGASLGVALGCLGTAVSCNPDLLALMHEGGFRWIHIGAESGSDKVLSFLNKRSTKELNQRAFKSCKEAGLRLRSSWILDAPSSTKEDLQRTVDAILESNSDEIRAHFFTVRIDSPFGDGVVGSDEASGSFPSQYIHANHPVCNANHLNGSAENLDHELVQSEIERLCNELIERGYKVLRESSEWGSIPAQELSSPEFKFISFCPARYGIGWSV